MRNRFSDIRVPISVNLEITHKCNLSCFFCFNASRSYSDMSKAAIAIVRDQSNDSGLSKEMLRKLIRIVDNLHSKGVFEIRLIGGEFMVFPYWRHVLKYAASRGFFLSFVSNGYLITKDDVETFVECGISSCTISLHGSEKEHDEVVEKAGCFQRVIESINMMTSSNITVSVAFTPSGDCESVRKSLYNLVQYLYRNTDVRDVAVNRLFQDDRYDSFSRRDYVAILRDIAKLNSRFDGMNVVMSDSLPRCIVPINLWKYLSYCSQGVGFAQVDYLGNLKHCSAISNSIGNILDTDIEDLWQKGLTRFRQLDHLPLRCKICPIFCGGGCTASRGSDNLFSPDEFVVMPGKESALKAMAFAAKNYVKRFLYRMLWHRAEIHRRRVYDGLYVPQKPSQYRLRYERDNVWLAMISDKGVVQLTDIGAQILSLIDGRRSISDILSLMHHHGISCTIDDINDVVVMVQPVEN